MEVTSGIGFLVGYFVLYSIRAGSKTQDAFKSLLGLGATGLAGGALFLPSSAMAESAKKALEASVLSGALTYAIIAIFLSLAFAYGSRIPDDVGDADAAKAIKIANATVTTVTTASTEKPTGTPDGSGGANTLKDVNTTITTKPMLGVWACFAVVLGRILFGEDFLTPSPFNKT